MYLECLQLKQRKLSKGSFWRCILLHYNCFFRFLKKNESKAEIGDHYELEIFKANHSLHAGFYQCLRTTSQQVNGVVNSQKKIEQLYFVDVFTDIPVIMREVEQDNLELPSLPKLNDMIFASWETSSWGLCNRCGKDMLGEQRRKVECRVQVMIFLDHDVYVFLAFRMDNNSRP